METPKTLYRTAKAKASAAAINADFAEDGEDPGWVAKVTEYSNGNAIIEIYDGEGKHIGTF